MRTATSACQLVPRHPTRAISHEHAKKVKSGRELEERNRCVKQSPQQPGQVIQVFECVSSGFKHARGGLMAVVAEPSVVLTCRTRSCGMTWMPTFTWYIRLRGTVTLSQTDIFLFSPHGVRFGTVIRSSNRMTVRSSGRRRAEILLCGTKLPTALSTSRGLVFVLVQVGHS